MLQLDEDSDGDFCNEEEITSLFEDKSRLLLEHKVVRNKSYILHLSGTAELNCSVAIGTSNDTCEVYNFSNNQIDKVHTLNQHSGGIVGVQYSPQSSSLLYTASVNGFINLWDLRDRNKLATQFKDTTVKENHNIKPLACFDVSSSNRLLAGGTELSEGEGFILFWDIRNVKLLGGYWESHTGDVTQVQFDPDNVNSLISGSTDGLINIYDVSKSQEYDATLNSLNTEASVEQLSWCKYKGKECICTITHTADIQLWKIEGVEPFVHFRRDDIGTAIKRKSSTYCYTVGAHSYNGDNVFLLAGSNWENGECLRAVQVNNPKLQPLFLLKENKQRVRCSWYNKHHNLLVTGGEGGLLNFWNIDIK